MLMAVQGCSHGGRAAPGHSPQLHPLCWTTYRAPCSLLTPSTSESATATVPHKLGRAGGWAFPLDPEESKQGKS